MRRSHMEAKAILAAAVIVVGSAGEAKSVLRATWDNDTFCRVFFGSACGDDQYTNGFLVTREPAADSSFWRFSLGQTLYTPTDLITTTPILSDQPYAAWLFAGFARIRTHPRSESVLEVLVGPTGPPAFGRQVQSAAHKVANAIIPQGWSNQLPTRLGLDVRASIERRVVRWPFADFKLSVEGEVGTIFRRAGLGARLETGSLRGGWRSPTPPSFSSKDSLGLRAFLSPKRGFAYSRVQVRWVSANYFLDGERPGGGGSWLVKEPWVVDSEVGLGFVVGSLLVENGLTLRSREHRAGHNQIFGTLRIVPGDRGTTAALAGLIGVLFATAR
jgi:lipid A 3-O-deacylase